MACYFLPFEVLTMFEIPHQLDIRSWFPALVSDSRFKRCGVRNKGMLLKDIDRKSVV